MVAETDDPETARGNLIPYRHLFDSQTNSYSRAKPRIEVEDVKAAAAGRWLEVLSRVGGIPLDILDRRGHPCPQCGGTDRFSLSDPEAGSVFCRKCFSKKNGDGIAAVQWMTGKDFPETLRAIADYLGTTPPDANVRAVASLPAKSEDKLFATMDEAIAQYGYLGKPSQVWEYVDAAGEVIAATLRFDSDSGEKTIRPVCQTPDGRWKTGQADKRTIYNLPEVLNADTVYVVEGEKCCDAMRSLGFVATTSPGGANGAGKADWTPLAGKEVCILPDNDEPGGEYAKGVASMLAKLNPPARCKVATLATHVDGSPMPPKSDVLDWIEGHGDSAEPETIAANLREVVARAEVVEVRTGSDGAGSEAAATPPAKLAPIQKFTFRELKKAYPKLHPPVIDGLLREGETANIIAASKVGKSWMAYDLLLSVATGKPWLDRFNTSKGRVLLIDNELHRPTIANRIPAVGQALELFESDYHNELDVWPLRGNLRSLEDLHREFEDVDRGYYRLVIFDARYRFSSEIESENDNAATTRFYNTLDRLAEQTGSALALIHHSSKGLQSDKSVVDVGAGAGAQARAADCHLVLRDHEEEGIAVMDGAVRSFAPVKSLALRWQFPIWVPDLDTDASQLKGRLTGKEKRQLEQDAKAQHSFIKALLAGAATGNQIRKRTGFGYDRLNRVASQLEESGQITIEEVETDGKTVFEYHAVEGSV